MKQNRMKGTRIATVTLLGALGAVSAAIPAHAETQKEALKRATTEIATLKQELAEQRALINKLLATQSSQKTTIEKIETRTAQAPTQVPAQVSAQASPQTPAQAVSSILPKGLTWYANLDINIANTDSGYGRKFTVGSGGMSATGIGLKGQKEVINGLSVIGEVEMGADLSTGAVSNGPGGTIGENNNVPSSGGLNGTGNQIFSRQAYAGLASDTFGKLTMGRQYTGSYVANGGEATPNAGPWGTGLYGNADHLQSKVGGMPTRFNNSIVYRTPSFEGFLKGFSVYASYSVGSENNVNANVVSGSGVTTDSAGEGYDLALFYRYKGLGTSVTTWNVNNASYNATGGETDLAQHKGWQAVANYDFGFLKLYGAYVSGWYSGGNYENVTKTMSDADSWTAGIKVPYGDHHTVMASYTELNDKSKLNQDASLVGITYAYKLFDATWLYTSWGKVFNSSNARYSLLTGGDLVGAVPATGYNPDGFMMGLLAKF